MKLRQLILSVVPCVCLAVAAQASVITLDWQFEDASGAAGGSMSPTPSGSLPENSSPWTATSAASNPIGGNPSATFSGYSDLSYSFGAVEGGGSAQGTYLMTGGQLALTLQNVTAPSPVSYTLTVFQAVANSGSGLDGLLTFSVLSGTYGGRVIHEAGDVNNPQKWVEDTWTWSSVDLSGGSPTLTITPTSSSPGDIWLDEVRWTMSGELSVVPEPIYAQGLAIVGMVAIGIGSSLRRKWQKRK